MTYALLDQTGEDNLHAARLLTVETRPFQRVSKRLTGSSTPIQSYLARPVQRPPLRQSDDEPTSEEEPVPEPLTVEQQQQFFKDLQRFREDVLLDFAAFDSSIARMQFLRRANEKERQRYAEEKTKIQVTADEVRDNTAQLKVRLEEARETLQIRKGYDVLAETITKDVRLKSRDEQAVNIERLRNEIEELEREGVDLRQAWVDRRQGLQRVSEEAARLRRIVRNEPEADAEVEKEEEGDGDDDVDGDVDVDGNMLDPEHRRRRDEGASNIGTPRPLGGTPGPEGDAATPLPTLVEEGGATPSGVNGDNAASTPPAMDVATTKANDIDMEDGEDTNEPIPQVKVDEMDTT